MAEQREESFGSAGEMEERLGHQPPGGARSSPYPPENLDPILDSKPKAWIEADGGDGEQTGWVGYRSNVNLWQGLL